MMWFGCLRSFSIYFCVLVIASRLLWTKSSLSNVQQLQRVNRGNYNKYVHNSSSQHDVRRKLPSSYPYLAQEMFSTLQYFHRLEDGVYTTFVHHPYHAVPDTNGNIYIAAHSDHTIRKVNATNHMSIYAGVHSNFENGDFVDGVAATSAKFNEPYSVWLATNGDLYVADYSNNRVRKIDHATNMVSTFAGTGSGTSSQNSKGRANATALYGPSYIWGDTSNNIYVIELGLHIVRKINTTNYMRRCFGYYSGSFDDTIDFSGPLDVTFQSPNALIGDTDGNVYIADGQHDLVWKYDKDADELSYFAGSLVQGYGGDGGAATSAKLNRPVGLAFDSYGALYIAENEGNRVRRVIDGIITTVFGIGATGMDYCYSNLEATTMATSVYLYYPRAISINSNDELIICDGDCFRILKASYVAHRPTAQPTVWPTIASYPYEDMVLYATVFTTLEQPYQAIMDTNGDMYLADHFKHTVRFYDTSSGIMSVYAGQVEDSGYVDDTDATSAKFDDPQSVWAATNGDLYVADTNNQRIRKIDYSSQEISTIAGTGSTSYNQDLAGAATSIPLCYPVYVWGDSNNDLYIIDSGLYTIRRINSTNIISRFMGSVSLDGNCYSNPVLADGSNGLDVTFCNPASIIGDSAGYMYIADYEHYVVWKYDPNDKKVYLFAGSFVKGFYGDGGDPLNAMINRPVSVAFDSYGAVYILENEGQRLRRVANGIITTVAGMGESDGAITNDNEEALALIQYYYYPRAIFITTDDAIYLTDSDKHTIRKLVYINAPTAAPTTATPTAQPSYSQAPTTWREYIGNMYTVAGGGVSSEDYILATNAELGFPWNVHVDTLGNLYIADLNNYVVQKVNTTGYMIRITGTPHVSWWNPESVAKDASITGACAVWVNPNDGILYICDCFANRILRVHQDSGTLAIAAGLPTYGDYSGDGDVAYLAYFNSPRGIWGNSNGDLFISDCNNGVVRRIDGYSYIISTYIGTVFDGSAVSNIDALSLLLAGPIGIVGEEDGTIYVVSNGHHCVWKYNSTSNKVTVYAGMIGVGSTTTLDGPATSCYLKFPEGLSIDADGNLYIVDTGNYVIRKVWKDTGIMTTIAGTFSENGNGPFSSGMARTVPFGNPEGVSVNPLTGDVYVADSASHVIRKIDYPAPTMFPSSRPSSAPSMFDYSEYGFTGVTVFAGSQSSTNNSNHVAATSASFNTLASDIFQYEETGDVYVIDEGLIKRIDMATMKIHDFAGSRSAVGVSNNVAATSTELADPVQLWMNSVGDMFVADQYCIRKVSHGTGIITNYAGNGGTTPGGSYDNLDNTAALDSTLANVHGVWGSTDGMLYATSSRQVVVRVTTDDSIHTVAGQVDSSIMYCSLTSGLGTSSALFMSPGALSGDSTGNIYIADPDCNQVWKYNSGTLQVFAGTGNVGLATSGTIATSANLNSPSDVNVDKFGNVYISDTNNFIVRKVHNGILTTAVANYDQYMCSSDEDIPLLRADTLLICSLGGIYVNTVGEMYISDFRRVLKATYSAPTSMPSSQPSSSPTWIYEFDNYPSLTEVIGGNGVSFDVSNQDDDIFCPYSAMPDTVGNLFIVSMYDQTIRKVDSIGITTLYAGIKHSSGWDDGTRTSSTFYDPVDLWISTHGDIYVAEYSNCLIRKISGSTNLVSTIAGTGATSASSGANGTLATSADIYQPCSIWGNSNGMIYFVESSGQRIRKISLTTQRIYDVVGTGTEGIGSSLTTGLNALSVYLVNPTGIGGDTAGQIYFIEKSAGTIWKVDTAGIVHMIAGSSSDTVVAQSSIFSDPESLAVDLNGFVYVADSGNTLIRRIDHGEIRTIAGSDGNSCNWSGDLVVAATSTSLCYPTDVYVDRHGFVYFTDNGNYATYKILYQQPSSQPTSSPSAQPSCQPSCEPSRQPSAQPTHHPVGRPTSQPSTQPSSKPSRQPSVHPSAQPTHRPSSQPSEQPTSRPTGQPTSKPTAQPSRRPSKQPSSKPSEQPTSKPSAQPSHRPSSQPSHQPTSRPTHQPTSKPTAQPSKLPSRQPSSRPSRQPSSCPTEQPTNRPTTQPSRQPTSHPTGQPSRQPTVQPSCHPSGQPSNHPSGQPVALPSSQPSYQPSHQPTSRPTRQPTSKPTAQPSKFPSRQPSSRPSRQPSSCPTVQPTNRPTTQPSRQPTAHPTGQPSRQPTVQPSSSPSQQPFNHPSRQPTAFPSDQPSNKPSVQPTRQPTTHPSDQPSRRPSGYPSCAPTRQPTSQPSRQPSCHPTCQPTNQPSAQPTDIPTKQPSLQPSRLPSVRPSCQPTVQPTGRPSRQPTSRPSCQPTRKPSSQPTSDPSRQPSTQPSRQPTRQPTTSPSSQPSKKPLSQPSNKPSRQPSGQPSRQPSIQPSKQPSSLPTSHPTSQPSRQPSRQPSSHPTSQPSSQPTQHPSGSPSTQPTNKPTTQPSIQSTSRPSSQPSLQPSSQPSFTPTSQPSRQPSVQPSSQPSVYPSVQPSVSPTAQPFAFPSAQPSAQPSERPSVQPTNSPTDQLSDAPTTRPTTHPSTSPSAQPSTSPSITPSRQPTMQPTGSPSLVPTTQPSVQPSCQPSSQPSRSPSNQPSSSPTEKPSSRPTRQPSAQPSLSPSCQPTSRPTVQPSCLPSSQPLSCPSEQPTTSPSRKPSVQPTVIPSSQPSVTPSGRPSSQPSNLPTTSPSDQPSAFPSLHPIACPTTYPSIRPTTVPSTFPTCQPSCAPSSEPTVGPSDLPSAQPSSLPTSQPTSLPTVTPSHSPTIVPTEMPSSQPSSNPSSIPSAQPSISPKATPTSFPTCKSTSYPTSQPSDRPSLQPNARPSSKPSTQPSVQPTGIPSTAPTSIPSAQPYVTPSAVPSTFPSTVPSAKPSINPSGKPSSRPTCKPTAKPTFAPTDSPTAIPSTAPTAEPSCEPTYAPTDHPTLVPTVHPSVPPTAAPTVFPTYEPSVFPSVAPTTFTPSTSIPTLAPTSSPTVTPTHLPSYPPSFVPTTNTPTIQPSSEPTITEPPSEHPTEEPTMEPSMDPTEEPSLFPSIAPSYGPSYVPSNSPTYSPTSLSPTLMPSFVPSMVPTLIPSVLPTRLPSLQPISTDSPTRTPTIMPTVRPSKVPTENPTFKPTVNPSFLPTVIPSFVPSPIPTALPSSQPTRQPISKPTSQPSSQPSAQPSRQPTRQPISKPSSQPSRQPTRQPTLQPFAHPSSQPIGIPTSQPTSLPTQSPTVTFAPDIESIIVSSTNTTVTVFVNLSKDGIVYVGLFEATSTSGSSPTRELIVFQNHKATTDHAIAHVSVSGLTPVENYVIYVVSRPITKEVWLSRDRMMETKTAFSTKCCKALSLGVTSTTLVEDTASLNWLSLSLSSVISSRPGYLLVRLSLKSIDSSSVDSSSQLLPYFWNVTTTSSTLVKQISQQGLSYGNYSLSVIISGPWKPFYRMAWSINNGQQQIDDRFGTHQQRIKVITLDDPLPAPNFASAVFASDGSYIDVSFSGSTDLGGSKNFTLSKSFACNHLLSFACANRSTCAWEDAKTVRIYPATSSGCIFVGSAVHLQSVTRIRTICSSKHCLSWPYMDTFKSIVTVVESPTVVSPSIVISAPSVISECSPLVIDTTTSTGNAGRAWKSSTISASIIVGSKISSVSSELSTFLAHKYVFFPPTAIPSNLFVGDETYLFTITLCNVFGKCNSAQKQVFVSKEEVVAITIAGQPTRTVTRAAGVLLAASATVTACTSTKKVSLTYSWNVTTTGNKRVDLVSSSKDPTKYLVGSNIFSTGTYYTFTAKASTGSRSSSAVAVVYVPSGNIIPVIIGGTTTMRSVRVGTHLRLDASGSYDENTVGSSKVTALNFVWSCAQTKPTINDHCADAFKFVDSTSSIMDGVALLSASADAVIALTLIVSDTTTKRSASVSVVVKVIQPLAPAVDIVLISNNNNKKLNAEDSVKLVGSVTVPSYLSNKVGWSLDGESSLQNKVSTPLESFFHSISSSSNLTTFNTYLVVSPAMLPVGTTYIFRLSSQLIADETIAGAGLIGSNSISFTTNRSPIPGIFVVSPRSGKELLQTFTFVSSQWLDEDLPLTYQYSYISPTGNSVIMRSRSESALATSVLPGSQLSDGAVNCQVDVFDSYLAKNTLTDTITVILLDLVASNTTANSTVSVTATLVTSLLQDFSSLSSLDEMKQRIAVSTYLMNKVDCSQASSDYCTSLNRGNCALTANTCGACLSVSDPTSSGLILIGEDGDSNQPCYWVSISDEAAKQRRMLDVNLVVANKTCLNNCSSHGTCQYFDSFSHIAVPSCPVDSLSCSAECVCDIGYTGKMDCSMSAADYAIKLQQRDQIFSNIVNVMNQEDASKESITGWIISIKELLGNRDELSIETIASILSKTHEILEIVNSTSLLSYYDSTNFIIPVIDDIIDARLLLSVSSDVDSQVVQSLLVKIDETLALFTSLVTQNIAPGQDTVNVLGDTLKVAVASSICSGSTNSTNVALTQSSKEKLLQRASSTVSLPSQAVCGLGEARYSAVTTSITSFSSRLLNSTVVSADPMILSMSSVPSNCVESDDSCFIEVTFDRKVDIADVALDDNSDENGVTTITCEEGIENDKVPVYCGSHTYTFACNGSAYTQQVRCPKEEIVSSCSGLMNVNDMSSGSGLNCTLLNYTVTSITCKCPLMQNSIQRRRLASTNTTMLEYSVSYVSLMQAMLGNIEVTFTSAGKLNASTIKEGWPALATLASIIILFLFSAGYSHYLDEKTVHQVVDEKEVEAAASGISVAEDIKTALKQKNAARGSLLSSGLFSFVGTSKSTPVYHQQIQRRQRISSTSPAGLMQLSEESLPIAINPSFSLKKRILMELKKNHRWAGVVFHFSNKFPRTLRVLALATSILSMLFIQSLTYGLTKGDDGSCATYKNEQDCLEPRSAFATGSPKCAWSLDTTPHCQYIPADSQEVIIVFVAVFSALLSTPIAIISTVIIQQVLAAPTIVARPKAANKIVVLPADTPPTGEANDGNGMKRSRRNRLTTRNMAELMTRTPGRLSNIIGGKEGALGAQTNFRLVAQKDLRRMTQQLYAYREAMTSAQEKYEFDAVWGIDPKTGRFEDRQQHSNIITKLVLGKIRNIIGVTTLDSIEELLRFDLERIARDFEQEKEMFAKGSDNNSTLVKPGVLSGERLNSERAKNKRLLFLFQRDLMPGITGHILESKDHRDQVVINGVTKNTKIAAWCGLLLMNSVMATYVFLFAINQTLENQRAWTRSFCMWLVMEIIVVSTVTVLITHIAIPSMVLKDVVKIRQHLSESINKYFEHLQEQQQNTVAGKVGAMYHRMSLRLGGNSKKSHESLSSDIVTGTSFNAAEYLFLSYRVAQLYPELKVAKVIREFSTPWPKQSYRNVMDVSKQYTKKFSALSKSIHMVAMFFLASVLVVPTPVQDMILEMFTVVFVGYVLYIHVQLWKIFPALVIVPGLLVLGILHFAINATRRYPRDENDDKNQKNNVRVSLTDNKLPEVSTVLQSGLKAHREHESDSDDNSDDDSQSESDDVSFDSFRISIGDSAFGDNYYDSSNEHDDDEEDDEEDEEEDEERDESGGSDDEESHHSRDEDEDEDSRGSRSGSDPGSFDEDHEHDDDQRASDVYSESVEEEKQTSQTGSEEDDDHHKEKTDTLGPLITKGQLKHRNAKVGATALLAAISNSAGSSPPQSSLSSSSESDSTAEVRVVKARRTQEQLLLSRRDSVQHNLQALRQAHHAFDQHLKEEEREAAAVPEDIGIMEQPAVVMEFDSSDHQPTPPFTDYEEERFNALFNNFDY